MLVVEGTILPWPVNVETPTPWKTAPWLKLASVSAPDPAIMVVFFCPSDTDAKMSELLPPMSVVA